MKKNIIITIVSVIVSGTICGAYYMHVYNDEAKKMGYTYNKETKQYEKKCNNLSERLGCCLDEYSLNLRVEERMNKCCTAVFSASLIVGLINGIIRRSK